MKIASELRLEDSSATPADDKKTWTRVTTTPKSGLKQAKQCVSSAARAISRLVSCCTTLPKNFESLVCFLIPFTVFSSSGGRIKVLCGHASICPVLGPFFLSKALVLCLEHFHGCFGIDVAMLHSMSSVLSLLLQLETAAVADDDDQGVDDAFVVKRLMWEVPREVA